MSRWFVIIWLVFIMACPVSGLEWTAPEPPNPAIDLMPEESDTFWEGVLEIFGDAIPQIMPSFSECIVTCVSVFAVVLLLSLVKSFPGGAGGASDLAGAAAIGILLLQPSNALVSLGAETVNTVSEYGKLLLPVMTAALAGSGGTTVSAALYAGTSFFDAVLGTIISSILVPLLFVFLCFSIAKSALGEETLKKLSDLVKWLMTWCLKTVLYIFTGYISITGVISGTADAAAVKATKLTLSGMVPVVGGILSDASEAVLVGAGLVRSTVGIYGLFAIIAICVRPFLQIGIQYLLLKATGAICDVFGTKRCVALVHDFSWAMGMLLAMTGAISLLLMVSIICFMRGVG